MKESEWVVGMRKTERAGRKWTRIKEYKYAFASIKCLPKDTLRYRHSTVVVLFFFFSLLQQTKKMEYARTEEEEQPSEQKKKIRAAHTT